jgi:hypothetical protein
MIKVKGYNNLVKDPSSGGVVNNDPIAYKNYIKKKELAKKRLEEEKELESKVISLESDINNIKSDVSDIKELLNNLISRIT